MGAFLQTKNNAKSISTGLDNTDDPVTFSVGAGEGALFPDTADGSFRVTVWSIAYADPGDDTDMEILEVTARSTDSFTATRAQEDTSKVAHSGTVNVALLSTSGLREEIVTAVDKKNLQDSLDLITVEGGFSRCIDKAAGDTAKTSAGWIEDEKYGWYLNSVGGTGAVEFDSATKRTGKYTLKLEITATNSYITVLPCAGTGSLQTIDRYTQRMKPSTKYRVRCWMKTRYVSGDAITGAYFYLQERSSAAAILATQLATKVKTTTDWTLYELNFTTNASTMYGLLNIVIIGNDGTKTLIMDAWFDMNSLTIEEVKTDTLTSPVAQKQLTRIEGVTSTDSIDQSLDSGGAYADTYDLTAAINEGATHIQTFTPTKKYTTQIGVWPIDKGSGNWTLAVHDSSNETIALLLIANASLTDGVMNYFDVPFIWTSGALHFHVISTVADGTLKSDTNNDLEDGSYVQRFAKRTEDVEIEVNGIKQVFKGDLLDGAKIVDLGEGKGKYLYDTGLAHLNTMAKVISFVLNVYSAESGDSPDLGSPIVLNAYRARPASSQDIWADNTAGTKDIIMKINTGFPILHFKHEFIGIDWKIAISPDNVTYTEIIDSSAANTDYQAETDSLNGLTEFYIRFQAVASQDCSLERVAFDIDLDFRGLKSPIHYPTGEDLHFSDQLIGKEADGDRIYFRKNKYDLPALELTNTTPTTIGVIFLKKDNSQETTPKVVIKSTTAGFQQTGTGAASGSDYELDDGEYMTLSSANQSEVSVDYYIPSSCNVSNFIFSGSYGSEASSVEDPSHQFKLGYGLNDMGLEESMANLLREVQEVKKPYILAGEGLLDISDDADQVTVSDSRIKEGSKILVTLNQTKGTLEADTIFSVINVKLGEFTLVFQGDQATDLPFMYFIV